MIIDAIRSEYLRYKALAEKAIDQLPDDQLAVAPSGTDNSIATICWHVSGNLQSRFTDFLTSDGEKPWRQRDEEFEARAVARKDLLEKWESGWRVLLDTLELLTDDALGATVAIRGERLTVAQALARSVTHTSYHVGQIVYIAKSLRGGGWTSLSIPPGQSAAYNRNPSRERPADHASSLDSRPKGS